MRLLHPSIRTSDTDRSQGSCAKPSATRLPSRKAIGATGAGVAIADADLRTGSGSVLALVGDPQETLIGPIEQPEPAEGGR